MFFFGPNRWIYQQLPESHASEATQQALMRLKGAAPVYPKCLDPTLTRDQLIELQAMVGKGIDNRQWLQWMEPVATASGYKQIEGVGAVVVGGKQIPVVKVELEGREVPLVPYPYLMDLGIVDLPSPQEYFAFLAISVRNPEDVHRLIAPPFGEWKDFGGKLDPFSEELQRLDQMEDEFTTLAKGGGACSELSWVAKRFLDVLGCKTGHDYKASVIGSGTHAVCVYQDTDGTWNSIDQVDHYFDIQDSYEASDLFVRGRSITEFILYKGNIRLEYPVDPVTRERKKDYMVAQVYQNYPGKENFKPENYLPSDWTEYREVQLFFYDGMRIFYRNKALYQTTDQTGRKTWYHAEDGHVIDVEYPGGKHDVYSREPHGRLLYTNYPQGVREYFDKETGTQVVRTRFSDHEDFFDQKTGDLTHSKHLDAKGKVHKIEYFYEGAIPGKVQIRRVEYLNPRTEKVDLAINFDRSGAATADATARKEREEREEAVRILKAPEWGEYGDDE